MLLIVAWNDAEDRRLSRHIAACVLYNHSQVMKLETLTHFPSPGSVGLEALTQHRWTQGNSHVALETRRLDNRRFPLKEPTCLARVDLSDARLLSVAYTVCVRDVSANLSLRALDKA